MTRKEEREQAARNFVSIEYSSPYTNFIQGAEWADRTMIDKVCEWLDKYMYNKSNGIKVKDYQLVGELIYNLRKAMEE